MMGGGFTDDHEAVMRLISTGPGGLFKPSAQGESTLDHRNFYIKYDNYLTSAMYEYLKKEGYESLSDLLDKSGNGDGEKTLFTCPKNLGCIDYIGYKDESNKVDVKLYGNIRPSLCETPSKGGNVSDHFIPYMIFSLNDSNAS